VIDWLTWRNKNWLFEYFNTQNPTQISKIKNVHIVAWIIVIETQRHDTMWNKQTNWIVKWSQPENPYINSPKENANDQFSKYKDCLKSLMQRHNRKNHQIASILLSLITFYVWWHERM
jgi:hypothetical protein